MNLLGATLVVVLFAVLIQLFRFVERTRDVLAISRESVETMRSESLTEREKESLIQKNSLQLFRLLGLLLLGSAVALCLPLALVWISEFAGLFSYQGVVDMLLRWDFIIAALFIGVAAYYAMARLNR